MKILVDYRENETEVIKVISAKIISEFLIEIEFNDGVKRILDFKPFLLKSLHPSISKYLNHQVFERFEIIDGNLNWNDYELIFPVWDLYKGEL